MVQTVVKAEEKKETLAFPISSLDDHCVTEFTLQGQAGGPSYEDRSVFFGVNSGTTRPDEDDVNNLEPVGYEMSMWLQGEQAIELGLKLIEHGKFALEANMIGHQMIHEISSFKKFLREGRIEEIEFKVVDENPANYGSGFRTYLITPLWVEGMAPEYEEDFTLEKVIYWSPFESEYADQLDAYTAGCSYSFIGYDRDEEVRIFEQRCAEMSGGNGEDFEVAEASEVPPTHVP